ncbi:hypothetical protein LTR09_001563 [Extremus antarcticus]|uniref:ABM domain-containing protein n=1 Tax=Extremus antarcticus TaxID=702011 RepID=A0AAJ0GH55_9PEZI|nr:hypothetical protein LTR09_001563 [Extremus antarcticus]
MSKEVTVTGVLDVKPGKVQKTKDFMAKCLKEIKENEKYCLEFRVLEEANDGEKSRLILWERYVHFPKLMHGIS